MYMTIRPSYTVSNDSLNRDSGTFNAWVVVLAITQYQLASVLRFPGVPCAEFQYIDSPAQLIGKS
jgi:hypothetical protein